MAYVCTAALSEARTTLPESSSRPLPAKTAHSRNLALASLETAVVHIIISISEIVQSVCNCMSKRNTAGIKIKNTTPGIYLTPPQKTGFMGRGEIDSRSGILNFYSGVITD